MFALINGDDKRVNRMTAVAALLLLIGCLAFNVHLVFASPNSGITIDARWRIISVEECDLGPENCPDVHALQVGDRIQSIGGLTLEQFLAAPEQIPFEGYAPGDVVPMTVLRSGQSLQVDWRLKPVEWADVFRTAIVSLLVYGSFWLAGTYVLQYIRPADLKWALLISLFYLATVWFAVGLNTQVNVTYAALILRVVGWLMVPVMVHLHLIVPSTEPRPGLKTTIILLYIGAIALLLLQLLGLLPWLAYLTGILLAALVSIAILAYRVVTPRPPSEKMIVRLMLTGIILAFVPGLLLGVIPLLLDIGQTDAFGIALSTLALPMLPFFYTYAIYKHRLGVRERRMNRWLVRYVLVLTYFSLVALVFMAMSNWLWTTNAVLAIPVLLGLSVVVALFPIRRPVLAGFERLTYGTRYSHRQILADFADRIPAAINMQELMHLLKHELAPQMEIRQSALLRRQDDKVETLYSQGAVLEERLATWNRTKAILQVTKNHVAAGDIDDLASDDSLAWARLAIPLRVKGRVTGAWLFGRRKSDDIYSEEDIELLDRLSGLVAVTLESSQLLDALSAELETRKAAEKRLAQQSQRLRMLHEIDQAVLAAGSPSEIAQSAFARLCQLVPCTRASVFLFEPELESMTILATQGSGGDLISDLDTIPFSEMPALEMLLHGQTFVENDMSQLADASRLASLLVPAGVRAVVSAPLLASGTAFGALAVAHSEPASFTKAHVAIVEEVATSIALAIHNARLRQEVDKSSIELRLLSARLIDAQETERKRLSHELHDEMGQLLTAISLKLAAVENRLAETDSQSLKELVSDADEFVVGLTNRVRSLSLELRPSMLRELGLVSTLRWFVASYAKRTEAEVRFEARDIPDHLPESVEITAYRVIQEALTNASRHSGATQIDLELLGQNGSLQVMVGDNGHGFDLQASSDAEPTSAGLGLIMMRERVTAINGCLEVSSEPGQGTIITARIPVEVEA